MLMAWGPFRFTIPNYSVEELRRTSQPRLAPQPVIGAVPTVHRLGPGNDVYSLQSTFYPHHLNGGGLAQLDGVREAVNGMVPLMLTHINGSRPNIFGLWIGTGLEDQQTLFDVAGTPCQVTTTLTLMQYGGGAAGARAIAKAVMSGVAGFGASINFNAGGIAASVNTGF